VNQKVVLGRHKTGTNSGLVQEREKKNRKTRTEKGVHQAAVERIGRPARSEEERGLHQKWEEPLPRDTRPVVRQKGPKLETKLEEKKNGEREEGKGGSCGGNPT